MDQKTILGYESSKELKEIIAIYNPKKIMLVTGKSSYEICGAKKTIEEACVGIEIKRFYEISKNPDIESLKKCLDFYNSFNPEMIISIGGGAAIDIGKATAIMATQKQEKVEDYVKGKSQSQNRIIHFIAIPTTFGTGSESTHFSVIYDGTVKYSFAHPSMLPDIAIVDSKFAYSLSKKIKATTVFDALSQAIESYWSINSTNESQKYSIESMKILGQNIVNYVNDKYLDENQKKELFTNIAKGANLAGKAINIAKTTAAHAASYPLSGHFNVDHGQAVALTIPGFVLYNSHVTEKDCNDPRGFDHVKKIMQKLPEFFGKCSVEELKNYLTETMKQSGLKTDLKGLGVENEIDLIIKEGFNPQRVKNNPRTVTEKALRAILEEIQR